MLLETTAKAALQSLSKEVNKMVEGTVKFFNSMKHFGFIAGDDGKEYFVHASGLREGTSIREGDKVSFKVVEGDKGLKAEEVEKIQAGESANSDSDESEEDA